MKMYDAGRMMYDALISNREAVGMLLPTNYTLLKLEVL